MKTKELDRKLTSALRTLLKGSAERRKRDEANRAFREVRRALAGTPVVGALDALVREDSTSAARPAKPSAAEAMKTLEELCRCGFAGTAALLVDHWRDALVAQKLEDVLDVLPDATSLEVWRKGARVPRVPVKELARRLLTDVSKAYATVGADWLLTHAKPQEVLPLWEKLLNRQERPEMLPRWPDAMLPALKNNKCGVLLDRLLRHPWPTKEPLKRLAEVMRLNRPVLKKTVEHLPAILCGKNAPEQGVFFVKELFATINVTQGADREFTTAALAQLGAGVLLQDRRGPVGGAVLELVVRAAQRLRNLTRDETLQSRTWVLESLLPGPGSPDDKAHVTIEGARRLALAFEKAAQGFAVTDILSATARNLGLTPVGQKGEVATYDPLRHEDMEDGMLPGDKVLIQEPGWAWGDEIVKRAQVKRGGSRV